MLREDEIEAALAVALAAISDAALPAPTHKQAEPNYTSSFLVPTIATALKPYRSLTCEGGFQRTRPVSYLGFLFYPDIAIMHYNRRLIAFEVKYLEGSDRQGALALALGQAEVYRLCGYDRSAVVLINRGRIISRDDIPSFTGTSAGTMSVVLRQVYRNELLRPGEIQT